MLKLKLKLDLKLKLKLKLKLELKLKVHTWVAEFLQDPRRPRPGLFGFDLFPKGVNVVNHIPSQNTGAKTDEN